MVSLCLRRRVRLLDRAEVRRGLTLKGIGQRVRPRRLVVPKRGLIAS